MADHVRHRPGPLKQTNKPHKTGRHRSKGAIDREYKGKIPKMPISHKQKLVQRKQQRRNHMQQIRKLKREHAFDVRRQLGGMTASPFLTCILPMHQNIDPLSALAILEKCDAEAVVVRKTSGITYISLPRFKQRFAFVIPPVGRGNEMAVLDYLKVCDTTLLLTSAAMGEDELFDKWGHRIFNMISAQGIPTPLVALMDLSSLNPKRRPNDKVAAQKFISKLLPEEKLMLLEENAHGLNVMRRISDQKKKILHNRNNRSHLFGDNVSFVENNNSPGEGVLQISGYLRGKSLDVNGLVHICGLGDYQMSKIDIVSDPFNLHNKRMPIDLMTILADPENQTRLQRENIPDEMDAEQTWPTEAEIIAAQKETEMTNNLKRLPQGSNDYQAAWIPDIKAVNDIENNDVNVQTDDDDDDDDHDSMEDEFTSCEHESFPDECEKVDSDNEEYKDLPSISETAADEEKYDLQTDLQKERETLKRIKEARIDEMWPDEIDTPQDVPARTRFQKYRGLESFRTSTWDAKENLPSDYARIFQFKNFDHVKRFILKGAKNEQGARPGWYIIIHVPNVSLAKWNAFRSAQETQNVIVYGILPHEHQMSLVNVILKRTPESKVPIKSKEHLIIQCGYRRFVANPIFSQHTNGDKHKFERYFRAYTVVVASFYAPIQFPPAPVLAFKVNPDTTLALVARGCLLSCNPNRIILKRIILSGHPMRINRRSATIRFMFFNKEDVEYFKPVKIRTKCGRVGHIKESLGTHGHMKCFFDSQLRSYDTVFMCLYKRVYPKWTFDDCLIGCEKKAHTETQTKVTAMEE